LFLCVWTFHVEQYSTDFVLCLCEREKNALFA